MTHQWIPLKTTLEQQLLLFHKYQNLINSILLLYDKLLNHPAYPSYHWDQFQYLALNIHY